MKSFIYSSEQPGPRLLVFGAIHGNEICGTLAIRRIMEELDTGTLALARGQVQFVPVANPRAHAAGQRYMERNLNRWFLPVEKEKAEVYEARLTNILCPMIERADYFIDLHSTTAGGRPFASVEGEDPTENALAAAMGAEILLYGWHEAYAASGKTNPDPDESMGTTAYARKHGAKAVLLECGQHKDPVSAEVAYRAIGNALRHIGLVDGEAKPAPEPLILRTTRVVFRGDGGSFTENWGNFSPVKIGQKVAELPNGAPVVSPADGYIILPNANTPPNTEWFYFGEKD